MFPVLIAILEAIVVQKTLSLKLSCDFESEAPKGFFKLNEW